jgi:hypothetical protein
MIKLVKHTRKSYINPTKSIGAWQTKGQWFYINPIKLIGAWYAKEQERGNPQHSLLNRKGDTTTTSCERPTDLHIALNAMTTMLISQRLSYLLWQRDKTEIKPWWYWSSLLSSTATIAVHGINNDGRRRRWWTNKQVWHLSEWTRWGCSGQEPSSVE